MWGYDKETISVILPEKGQHSTVLDKFGEPYVVERGLKIGFDLTPKERKQNARKTSWEKSHTV